MKGGSNITMDMIIKNARLRKKGNDLFTIAVNNGKIEKIVSGSCVCGDKHGEVIDAKGRLVTESFVNGHLHLCKVYTLEMVGQDALNSYHSEGMGGAMTAIEQAARVKENYDEKWIINNVRKACNLALKYGNTHIRAFADVDPKAKLEGVKALLKAKEEYRDTVDLQIVAFPQDGIVRDPGAESYVEKALELGADVVGGIPWIEFTPKDEQEHVDRMFALAKKYNKDVSMLLDDVGDPGERTLEMVIAKTLEMGWQGRVTAQHCRAVALYQENHFRKLVSLLKKADIGLVSDPQTGPLHARVADLYNAGINVALGQDDIADAYYPFGRNNMLEVAFLAVHLLWMTTFEGMETIYDMITTNAARAMGIKGHLLEEGGTADLVILNAEDIYHAIWEHEAPAYVIRKGVNVTKR